jgi:hypothetical protein
MEVAILLPMTVRLWEVAVGMLDGPSLSRVVRLAVDSTEWRRFALVEVTRFQPVDTCWTGSVSEPWLAERR